MSAYEIKGMTISLIASVAISEADKWKPVKIVGDSTFDLIDADTDVVIGVVQNECRLGEAAQIMVNGVTMYKCTGSVVAGAKIGSWGIALEAGVLNDVIPVYIGFVASGVAVEITTSSLGSITEETAMTPITLAATGTTPITYSLAATSAALPAGVTLSKEGVISGTPANNTAGVKALVINAVNCAGTDQLAANLTVVAN